MIVNKQQISAFSVEPGPSRFNSNRFLRICLYYKRKTIAKKQSTQIDEWRLTTDSACLMLPPRSRPLSAYVVNVRDTNDVLPIF